MGSKWSLSIEHVNELNFILINVQHVINELNFMLIVHSKTKTKDYHLSNIRARGTFYFLVFTFTQQNKEMWLTTSGGQLEPSLNLHVYSESKKRFKVLLPLPPPQTRLSGEHVQMLFPNQRKHSILLDSVV
jgi:hypothetical protein